MRWLLLFLTCLSCEAQPLTLNDPAQWWHGGAASGAGVIYPLDIVPGAIAAYGTIKLSASAQSNCIELRKYNGASSNFVWNSNEFPGDSITNFAAFHTPNSHTNVFISTIYDQVGTNNLTQQITNQQPALKLSEFGRWSIYGNADLAVGPRLQFPDSFSGNSTNTTMYFVFRADERTYSGYTSDHGSAYPTFRLGTNASDFGGYLSVNTSTRITALNTFANATFRQHQMAARFDNLNYKVIALRTTPTNATIFLGHGEGTNSTALSLPGTNYFGGELLWYNAISARSFGEIVALLVYQSHSDTTVLEMISLLNQRCNLQKSTINLWFDGDSIPAGYQVLYYGAGNRDAREKSWPGKVVLGMGRSDIRGVNCAVSSTVLSNMVTLATNRIDRYVTNGYAHNILVLYGGINDLNLGVDSTNVYNALTNYHMARRIAGWKTIACDLIPYVSFSESKETERTNLNAMIAATWTNWADAYAPVSTNGWLTGATNYQDGIHPNEAGVAKFTNTVIPVLRSLLE